MAGLCYLVATFLAICGLFAPLLWLGAIAFGALGAIVSDTHAERPALSERVFGGGSRGRDMAILFALATVLGLAWLQNSLQPPAAPIAATITKAAPQTATPWQTTTRKD